MVGIHPVYSRVRGISTLQMQFHQSRREGTIQDSDIRLEVPKTRLDADEQCYLKPRLWTLRMPWLVIAIDRVLSLGHETLHAVSYLQSSRLPNI